VSGNRSSSATIRARVDIVYRLLLLGLDRQRIIDHVHKKYPAWPKSDGAIDRYIKKADQILIEVGEADHPLERGRSLARRHDIFARCMTDKNYRTALAAQDKIDELLGLKAPLRVDIATVRQQLVDLLLEDVIGEADAITRGSAE
jgi:hypothetical protein